MAPFVWHDYDVETGVGNPDSPTNAANLTAAFAEKAALDDPRFEVSTAQVVLTARTGVSFSDIAGDDVNNWSTTWPAKRWDLRMGTAAVPSAGGGSGFKISQTEKITNLATQMGGAQGQNQANAALHVAAKSVVGSFGQTCAILATASGANSGADVCSLASWGRVTAGSGTAFGAYLEGRRDVGTAHAIGAEIGIRDFSASDGVLTTTGGSDTMGVWVTTVGTVSGQKAGAGVVVGAGSGAQWIAGFQAIQGVVSGVAFRDESQSTSETSFAALGTHGTGLDLSGATFTNHAIQLQGGTTAAAGIAFGTDAELYRSGAGQLRITGNLVVSGTISNDAAFAWVTPTLGNSWVVVDAPRAPKYKMKSDAVVWLQGMMKLGTVQTAVFVLPTGARPTEDLTFQTASDTGTAQVKVYANGNVMVWSYSGGGTNAFVSLAGIQFSTN